QRHDPHIITPIRSHRPSFRMAAHGMIRCAHTQTPHHGRKKDAENNDVCFFNPRVAAFEEVKKDADEEKEEATQEVGMNVDGFVMQVEERLEAFGQGAGREW
ncbi:MAG: hypothetical protein Q9199_005486, partial [Rusavskia elegans]